MKYTDQELKDALSLDVYYIEHGEFPDDALNFGKVVDAGVNLVGGYLFVKFLAIPCTILLLILNTVYYNEIGYIFNINRGDTYTMIFTFCYTIIFMAFAFMGVLYCFEHHKLDNADKELRKFMKEHCEKFELAMSKAKEEYCDTIDGLTDENEELKKQIKSLTTNTAKIMKGVKEEYDRNIRVLELEKKELQIKLRYAKEGIKDDGADVLGGLY